jgi:NADH-quinone oxidoreductase subunit L
MNSLTTILEGSISFFLFLPLIAFFATLIWKNRQEKPIAIIVQATKAVYVTTSLLYAVLWLANGYSPVSQHLLTLYATESFVFAIQFYYDGITAVYSVVGSVIFFLVSTFSRYYMHRDEGFKRFFNTILLFAVGYNLIIFSGNFETLFIGWEIIGLSSFLLIAFYRNRYLPVKNAFKTLSNYRLGDVAMMLVMWMMHHLTHQNISFTQLAAANEIAMLGGHTGMAAFIMIMIILAAMIKSAQLPFTTWLPRAMEGPTSSSAIFYGSLSVHIGVFLLLRTYPFWQDILWVKITIIIIGILTGIIATAIARTQPTVKTQIAYSSAAQIGLIFIEVALGFHVLALVHFAGNAFLRTYQLLVSPSVLNYLVHHQYFHYRPPMEKSINKLKTTLYVLGIKEWNLDSLMQKFLWDPFKWMGNRLQFLGSVSMSGITALAGIAFILIAIIKPAVFVDEFTILPILLLAVALGLILFSFSHRGSAITAWINLLIAHIFIIASVKYYSPGIPLNEILMYLSGIVVTFLLGLFCLQKKWTVDRNINLDQYHGYVYEQKTNGLLFFLGAIGILGFPVTAAFIGIDVLFTYIRAGEALLITLLALCFLFIELAAIRIFLRIYLGLHKKLDHPIAIRST